MIFQEAFEALQNLGKKYKSVPKLWKTCLSVFLSLSVPLSVCLSVCLFVCLSVCLSVCPHRVVEFGWPCGLMMVIRCRYQKCHVWHFGSNLPAGVSACQPAKVASPPRRHVMGRSLALRWACWRAPCGPRSSRGGRVGAG